MKANFFQSISKLGLKPEHTSYERKIRTFFNQIMFIGGTFMFLQSILFSFVISLELGLIMVIGPIGCTIALLLVKQNKFLFARVLSFSAVMIGGGLSSALIGKDHAFHLASLNVIVATVICFSRKEFIFSTIPLLLAIVAIGLTESDVLVKTYPNLPPANEFRIMTIVATLLFVLIEVYFITGMSENAEVIADKKLKKSSQTVKIQNEEIQLMMREIHHRVKNNLQIIISLLRLRSNDLSDEKAKQLFDTTIDRIQSMSILHQKIYQSRNISKFNVQDYIETLTNNLISSHAIKCDIELEVNSNIEEIDNDFIVSFALILNELISNSLKHAFNDKQNGKIQIEFNKQGKELSLFYKDSGQWKKPATDDSFGLELIGLLTEQIQGSFERKTPENGTEYHFSF